MASQYIAQTPATYGFPLLIKGLLESGVTRAPEQEIVSANQHRLTYWSVAEAEGLTSTNRRSLVRLNSEMTCWSCLVVRSDGGNKT